MSELRLATEHDREASLAALSQQHDEIATQQQTKFKEELGETQKQLTVGQPFANKLNE